MAQLMNVRLSRVDAQPWGLRLQGGKDFGTPLLVQKVSTILLQNLILNGVVHAIKATYSTIFWWRRYIQKKKLLRRQRSIKLYIVL